MCVLYCIKFCRPLSAFMLCLCSKCVSVCVRSEVIQMIKQTIHSTHYKYSQMPFTNGWQEPSETDKTISRIYIVLSRYNTPTTNKHTHISISFSHECIRHYHSLKHIALNGGTAAVCFRSVAWHFRKLCSYFHNQSQHLQCTPFLVSIVLQRFQAPDAKIRINTFNKRTHFSPHCDIQLVVQIKHKHFVIFGFQKMFKIVYYLYIGIDIPLVSHAVLVYIMAKSPLTSVLSKYKSIHTQPQPYICHSKIVFGFYHNR